MSHIGRICSKTCSKICIKKSKTKCLQKLSCSYVTSFITGNILEKLGYTTRLWPLVKLGERDTEEQTIDHTVPPSNPLTSL